MSLSARGLSLVANTACPRLDALAHVGVSDTTAAKAYGYTTKQPRLAYALGKAFEERITHDAQTLGALVGAVDGEAVYVDDSLADARLWESTRKALENPAVSLIVQGAVPGLIGGWLRPDILIRTPNGSWRVGEIKIYLDKGALTDAHSISAALTQAAASAVSITAHAPGVVVDDAAVLVLTDLVGAPVAHVGSIGGELTRLRSAVSRIGYKADAETVPDAGDAKHIYSAACIGACALADYCREKLVKDGVRFPSAAFTTTTGISESELLDGQWADYARSLIPG